MEDKGPATNTIFLNHPSPGAPKREPRRPVPHHWAHHEGGVGQTLPTEAGAANESFERVGKKKKDRESPESENQPDKDSRSSLLVDPTLLQRDLVDVPGVLWIGPESLHQGLMKAFRQGRTRHCIRSSVQT